jgi:hypothetical protein
VTNQQALAREAALCASAAGAIAAALACVEITFGVNAERALDELTDESPAAPSAKRDGAGVEPRPR